VGSWNRAALKLYDELGFVVAREFIGNFDGYDVGVLTLVYDPQRVPSLVGTWRLVSFVTSDGNGGARQYWDERASGLIIYTSDGHVSAQVYDARRPRLGTVWEQAGASAAQVAFTAMVSYFGRYRVDAARGTVTHSIEGAMAPDWIGTELVRGYRFVGPNRVELRLLTAAEGPSVGNTVLVWERVSG
jgi:Lipocalin-like domain